MADDLSSYFDKSIAAVRGYSAQFDHDYAQPAYSNIKGHFDERPIISTFVSIFSLLSLVPVAFFVGTSLCIIFTFVLAALSLALLAASGIVLILLSFLVLILIGTLFVSIFLTGIAVSSYLLVRLALHVRREGTSEGVSEWGKETKRSLLDRLANRTDDRSIVESESNGSAAEKAPLQDGVGDQKDE